MHYCSCLKLLAWKYSSKANTLYIASSACVSFHTSWLVSHSLSWLCVADLMPEADPAEISVSSSTEWIASLQLFCCYCFSGAEYFQYPCFFKTSRSSEVMGSDPWSSKQQYLEDVPLVGVSDCPVVQNKTLTAFHIANMHIASSWSWLHLYQPA